MAHPERPEGVASRVVIAHLQQSGQALMDGDRVLPDDGSSLLAALDRALAGPDGDSASAARAGIEAFIGWVRALVDAGVLEATDARPRIEAAAARGALLRSAGGTDLETRRGQGDSSRE
jgi:hypothetical protein